MYKEHPLFVSPPSDAILWRYMDFTRFVSLLEKQALFFARADKLGDPFEGALSRINVAMHPVLYKDEDPNLRATMAYFMKESRRFTLVNCWHESPHESAAMWRLYSGGAGSIAVRSDQDSLTGSLIGDDDVHVGRVAYVNYERHFIPEGNSFHPYLHKRRSFEHEREVRAVIQRFPTDGGKVDLSKDLCAVGKYQQVNVSTLVKQVVFSPYAQDWFGELVASVARRYGLEVPVGKSALAEPPTWG